MTPWIRSFRTLGYKRIIVILMIREPIATASSMIKRNHHKDFEDAYAHRIVAIANNLVEALAQRVELEILTYEGLTESFLKKWLPRIGLPTCKESYHYQASLLRIILAIKTRNIIDN